MNEEETTDNCSKVGGKVDASVSLDMKATGIVTADSGKDSSRQSQILNALFSLASISSPTTVTVVVTVQYNLDFWQLASICFVFLGVFSMVFRSLSRSIYKPEKDTKSCSLKMKKYSGDDSSEEQKACSEGSKCGCEYKCCKKLFSRIYDRIRLRKPKKRNEKYSCLQKDKK